MIAKKNFSDFIMSKRVIVILLLVFLTVFLGYEVTKVKLNADFSTYLKQDDPLVQEFNRIGEIFAAKSIAMVLIESEDVFSTQTLSLVQNLGEAYENVDGISSVTSLTNILDFKKTEWGLEVGKLIQRGEIPQSKKELRRLRDYVMSKEMYVGDLVSEDGKATNIILRLSSTADESKLMRELRQVTDRIALSTENVSFGGMPALMDSMMILISENMNVLVPIMVGLILLVLILAFRRPGGIFFPLIIVGLAVVLTMGLMALFGLSVDLLSGIMPVILIAMGSADGIHFMKRYYERKRIGEIPRVAIKNTFDEMWMPMLITTITSMVGFISLVISKFSVITQFGLVTSLGIFLAFLITLTLLPAVLSFSRVKVESKQKNITKRNNSFMEKIGDIVYRNKIRVLVLAAVVIVTSIVGISKIVKDVDWSLCLQKGSKPHHAEMLLREKFGGSLPVQVLVKGDAKDPATLKSMRYVERFLNTLPLVSESQSIASIISEMNDIVNDRYTVPETREGVANLLFLIEDEDIMEHMVTADYSEALIQGKLATMDTKPLVSVVERINEFIESLPKSLAVFDLRQVPSQQKKKFIKIRERSIASNVLWDLKGRGIDVDRSKIEELVTNALFQEKIEEGAYIELEKKLVSYFLSDESEIMFTSENRADTIARKITESLKRDGRILPEKVANIVKSEIKGVYDQDVEFLSESIIIVTSETLGEIRVKLTLEALREILTPGSGEIRDLYRDLKGDLWEMNENLMTMNLDEFRKISGGFDPPEIREVQISMRNVGLAPVLKQMEEALTPSQIFTLLIAMVFVVLMLTLILRSVVGSFISVIPISMTILVNFAVMGYGGIGLDSFTSMIASIAIGLGIDYAVHFNSRFRRELSVLKDELQALKRTLSTTGVAIVINALTVGLGFSVLLFAGGQHIRRFGGLTALTLFTSAIFTLVVLPALTLVFRPRYLRKAKD